MNTWVTSDTHFGHRNIINFSRRPFRDVQEMDEQLITNWNALIGPEDTVYHLGDFLWYSTKNRIWSVLERLNGLVTLIVGNHDKSLLNHGSDFFEEICCYKKVEIQGQTVIMHHYPAMEWDGSFRGSYYLHGHSHNQWPASYYRRLDVGVDGHHQTPWNFEEIRTYMDQRMTHDSTIYNPRKGRNP